jgi:hypothetical protein
MTTTFKIENQIGICIYKIDFAPYRNAIIRKSYHETIYPHHMELGTITSLEDLIKYRNQLGYVTRKRIQTPRKPLINEPYFIIIPSRNFLYTYIGESIKEFKFEQNLILVSENKRSQELLQFLVHLPCCISNLIASFGAECIVHSKDFIIDINTWTFQNKNKTRSSKLRVRVIDDGFP